MSAFETTIFDWDLDYFTPDEFPDPVGLGDPRLFAALDAARRHVGRAMHPSPASGAFARFGGNRDSQHYVGEDADHVVRRTTACDVFICGTPMENLMALFGAGLFTGIGIYPFTWYQNRKWPMFHLDIRAHGYKDGPLFWIGMPAPDGTLHYRYPQVEKGVWNRLREATLYIDIRT